MKNLIKVTFLFLIFTFPVLPESFIQKQERFRAETKYSTFIGTNYLANSLLDAFLSVTYTLNSSFEIGGSIQFSKSNNFDEIGVLPIAGYKTYTKKTENSGKIFLNYFILELPFFFNLSIGYLPNVTSGLKYMFNENKQNAEPVFNFNNSEFSLEPTFYISPGLGYKLIFDGDYFFYFSVGSMYFNKREVSKNYSVLSSSYQNINQEILIYSQTNLFRDQIMNSVFKNYDTRIETYNEFGFGLIFK
ncbi:hypothetical protein EHR04_05160 [Leptospira levettii]|uniref:Outer membrane protein beta-barrel domain-containing protein n=2 Tax=Leptospira levettii TaxID=2023178 RepID=A0A6H3NDZ8_9LEPT|nr:hypothetical protein [Leptospira levettii]MCW7466982.1 hypothetical protein [Leptospira levettii]MCW7497902.1 hypothetical protein [Leptospira levettii]MCW7512705.1 hypothetical protein [Leptospira levettii]MCW7516426.1 hypothetical protein [Leptospira levettii]TGM74998.1 hypothetical protein EHR04_05160 [Leptospira levettii]